MTGAGIAGEPPGLNREDNITLFRLLCEGKSLEKQNLDKDFKFEISTLGEECNCGRDLEYQQYDQGDIGELLSSSICNHCMDDLSEHIRPACRNQAVFYPLHIAAAADKPHMVKWLIELGADVNCRTSLMQLTPLHICATHGSINSARVLIENGADANIPDKSSHTAITWAAFNEELALLQFFLDRNDVLNHVDSLPERMDLVHICMDLNECSCEALEIVIKAGVGINGHRNGRTPLLRAIEDDNPRIVELLLQSPTVDVNAAGFQGQITPLCAAIECGTGLTHWSNLKIISLLLEAGANPNLCSEGDNSPLMMAAVESKPHIVKLLIEHGADVNLANSMGYQALHWAAWDNLVGVVKELLAAGAKPDCQTNDKNTPLSLAAHGNAMTAFNMLLPLGCNVNNRDKDMDTALHYAAYNGNLEMVRSLVKQGGDPEMMNDVGATPLWNAVYQNHWSVFQYLLKLNVPLDVPSKGIDQHAQSSDVVYVYPRPVTPFYVALDTGCFPMAQCLTLAGYNITKEYCLQTGDVPGALFNSPEMMDWLDEVMCEPPSLMSLCRYQIRQVLGRRVRKKVQKLEVPIELKHHLLLTDLTSIQLYSPDTILDL